MFLKIFLILFVVILAGTGLYWVTTRQSPAGQTPTNKQSPAPPNWYLIAGMKQRTYDTDLMVDRLVRKTSGFTSYIVNFSSDGLNQFALMNVPTGKKPKTGWPVVVVNHGYIDPQVFSTPNSYINTSGYFADAGFLVFKPDYRGHADSQGDARGLFSRIGYAVDVLNLIAGIKKYPDADPDRIFMYGHSMGGDVTLRVLEVCGGCLRAATLWAPAVTDWPQSFMYFVRQNDQDPDRQARRQRLEKELSAIPETEYTGISTLSNIGLVNVPVNIHHGTLDESVPYKWGVDLAARFSTEKKENYFYSYPGDNHDISRNWSVALNRDIEFFNSKQ